MQKKIDQMKKKKISRIETVLLKKSRQYLVIRVRQQIPNGRLKKIEMFKQHITDFMIEFEVLAIKIETDDIHMIFLLKKNIRSNIIKTMLGYLSIVAPESLKE